MRIAVMLFPGTNCENETKRAAESVGMKADLVRWNSHKGLEEYDGYILPGGWSYEDRVRAGVIAAQDPVIGVIREQAREGKPVLGICNGAQVLVETGMVPGIKEGSVDMALAPNINPMVSGFYCTWVWMKNTTSSRRRCAFARSMDRNQVMPIPIAHAEGRFATRMSDLPNQLFEGNHIAFKYCTPEGREDPGFPANPNGSIENIAAVCNRAGNVMAMMPHPERACWARQLPYFERRAFKEMDAPGPGRMIFHSMRSYIEERIK